ncbi:hypothetical protein KKF47_02610 [Patescibacteria group bacterium]|nr:hypothetical protein [Patescibacteria group bacterium]
MGNFKKRDGGRNSGGGSFGGRSSRRDGGRGNFGGRNRDRGPVTMHQAVCDQCKNSCEVPFRPSGDKPVYCNDCFGGKKEGGNDRGRDRFPQRSQNSYRAPARSDFRSDSSKGSNDGLVKQLEVLNTKIDRLIGAIEVLAKPVKAKQTKKKEGKS